MTIFEFSITRESASRKHVHGLWTLPWAICKRWLSSRRKLLVVCSEFGVRHLRICCSFNSQYAEYANSGLTSLG
jgi:hypothetical protein